MKIKKEYVILACVIAALAAYLAFERTGRMHYEIPEVPAVKKSGITKLEIGKGKETVVLNRREGNWFIAPQDYRADGEKVGRMLDALKGFRLTTLVSESGNYFRYDLTDEKKITVKAWEGTAAAIVFEMGKSASTYRHTFVRMADDDKVYQASGNFRNDFDQTGEELRDRQVLSFARDTVTGIAIEEGEKRTELKRSMPAEKAAGSEGDAEKAASSGTSAAPGGEVGPEWRDAGGAVVAASGMEKLFSAASDLDCDRYVPGRTKADYREPVLTVRFEGDGSHTLSIFEKAGEEDEDHPAVSSGSDYPFILKGYQVEDIRSAIAEIRGEKKEE